MNLRSPNQRHQLKLNLLPLDGSNMLNLVAGFEHKLIKIGPTDTGRVSVWLGLG